MARLSEPDETQLPTGPSRDLVLAIHEAYRAAGSPSFRRIEAVVEENDDYDDTVSRQTISLLLNGMFIPRWSKINCLVRQLAAMSSPRRDPDGEAARFLRLWNALDHTGTDQPANAAVAQNYGPGHSPEVSPQPAAMERQAGRYGDGSQVLPDGGLAQVDKAITRLTSGEYQRGWTAGLEFVEHTPVWEILEDLAGHSFNVEAWITAHRENWRVRMVASGRGEADLPNWWTSAAGDLGSLADPFGLEEYRFSRSARYLAGYGDALRAAWVRAGGRRAIPYSPPVVNTATVLHAIELVDLQLAELAAAAAPASPNYRPDEHAYQDRQQELRRILDGLHVAVPYRWGSVATAVGALKAEFTGNGAYARRRKHLLSLRDQTVAKLEALPTGPYAAADDEAATLSPIVSPSASR